MELTGAIPTKLPRTLLANTTTSIIAGEPPTEPSLEDTRLTEPIGKIPVEIEPTTIGFWSSGDSCATI